MAGKKLLEEIEITVHKKDPNKNFPSTLRELRDLPSKKYQLKTTRTEDIEPPNEKKQKTGFLRCQERGEEVIYVQHFVWNGTHMVLDAQTPLWRWDEDATVVPH